MRKIKIQKGEDQTDEEVALKFAKDVALLTNDMFIEVSCDEIEKFIDENRLFFVYYGSVISLDRTHTQMRQVVAYDRFSFNEYPVQFFINADAECKKQRGFDGELPAVALYVHSTVPPFTR